MTGILCALHCESRGSKNRFFTLMPASASLSISAFFSSMTCRRCSAVGEIPVCSEVRPTLPAEGDPRGPLFGDRFSGVAAEGVAPSERNRIEAWRGGMRPNVTELGAGAQ